MQAVALSAIDEYIARRTHRGDVATALARVLCEEVRDYGLLESALARPSASVFGADAYPDLHLKAAALMQSLALNHALVDGNKPLAWTACRMFLAINGQWISASEDDRFDFVVGVATGALAEWEGIAARLRAWSYQEG